MEIFLWCCLSTRLISWALLECRWNNFFIKDCVRGNVLRYGLSFGWQEFLADVRKWRCLCVCVCVCVYVCVSLCCSALTHLPHYLAGTGSYVLQLFSLSFFIGGIVFLGFSGNFKPSWTKLFTSPAEQGLGVLEQYVPLQMEDYGCPRAGSVHRRDLELLQRASKVL